MYQSFSLRPCSSLASIPFPLRSLLFLVLFVSPLLYLGYQVRAALSPCAGSPRLPWLRTRDQRKKSFPKMHFLFHPWTICFPFIFFSPFGLFRIKSNWCFRFPLAKQTIEFYSSVVVFRLSDYGLMTRRFVCCLSSSIFSGLDSPMCLSSCLLCLCAHHSRVLCLALLCWLAVSFG